MSDAPTLKSDELRERALALYTPPFRFTHGYIYDAAHKMVGDQGGFEGKVTEAVIARIRGWGRISYMADAEALQDMAGELVAEALTEFWNRRAALAASREAAEGWRDISEAPKDGTVLLVVDGRATVGGWVSDLDHGADYEGQIGLAGWWALDGPRDGEAPSPTHWMPLPPPPSSAMPATTTKEAQ